MDFEGADCWIMDSRICSAQQLDELVFKWVVSNSGMGGYARKDDNYRLEKTD